MERRSVGLDIAKDQIDVHVRPSGERSTLANDESGIRELVRRLQTVSPVLVVLEATGGRGGWPAGANCSRW